MAHKELTHGRSREGAWIEMFQYLDGISKRVVAPVRERGLKFASILCSDETFKSLP